MSEEEKKETKKKKKKGKGDRKEIELTYGEAEDLLMNRNWESLLALKLPFKTNYWLKRIRQILSKHEKLQEYFKEKEELQKEHCKLDAEGNPTKRIINRQLGTQVPVFKDNDNRDKYSDKIGELRDEILKLESLYYLQIDFDEEGEPVDERYQELNGYHIDLLFPLLEEVPLL